MQSSPTPPLRLQAHTGTTASHVAPTGGRRHTGEPHGVLLVLMGLGVCRPRQVGRGGNTTVMTACK